MKRNVGRATLLIAVSACCFGSISPLTVVAMKHGAALQAVQAWRYATTAVLLTLYAWWRARASARGASPSHGLTAEGQAVQGRWYAPLVLMITGGGQASVATLALLALRWIPAATTSFLFYTYPAWVAILAAVRGTDRLDRVKVVALGLALGGIAAMVGAPDAARLAPAGVISVMSAAVIYAVYIPVLGNLQRAYAPIDVARAISVGGGVLFVGWSLATGTLFSHLDAQTLAASMAQGILSAGAFIGFLAGLSTLGPVRTAITSTVEPFWTTMLGVVALNQPLGRGTVLGGAAIMGAVLLLQRPSVPPGGLHSSTAQTGDHTGRPTP